MDEHTLDKNDILNIFPKLSKGASVGVDRLLDDLSELRNVTAIYLSEVTIDSSVSTKSQVMVKYRDEFSLILEGFVSWFLKLKRTIVSDLLTTAIEKSKLDVSPFNKFRIKAFLEKEMIDLIDITRGTVRKYLRDDLISLIPVLQTQKIETLFANVYKALKPLKNNLKSAYKLVFNENLINHMIAEIQLAYDSAYATRFRSLASEIKLEFDRTMFFLLEIQEEVQLNTQEGEEWKTE